MRSALLTLMIALCGLLAACGRARLAEPIDSRPSIAPSPQARTQRDHRLSNLVFVNLYLNGRVCLLNGVVFRNSENEAYILTTPHVSAYVRHATGPITTALDPTVTIFQANENCDCYRKYRGEIILIHAIDDIDMAVIHVPGGMGRHTTGRPSFVEKLCAGESAAAHLLSYHNGHSALPMVQDCAVTISERPHRTERETKLTDGSLRTESFTVQEIVGKLPAHVEIELGTSGSPVYCGDELLGLLDSYDNSDRTGNVVLIWDILARIESARPYIGAHYDRLIAASER
jgi:hypothetical protein